MGSSLARLAAARDEVDAPLGLSRLRALRGRLRSGLFFLVLAPELRLPRLEQLGRNELQVPPRLEVSPPLPLELDSLLGAEHASTPVDSSLTIVSLPRNLRAIEDPPRPGSPADRVVRENALAMPLPGRLDLFLRVECVSAAIVGAIQQKCSLIGAEFVRGDSAGHAFPHRLTACRRAKARRFAAFGLPVPSTGRLLKKPAASPAA